MVRRAFSILAAGLLVCGLPSWAVAQADGLLITEFQAFNTSTLLDEDGDTPDWIEFYNAGSTTLNLEGLHLTDSTQNLTKWTFPAVLLEPGRFLVVFASEKDRRDPAGELHTNFRLERGGGEPIAVISADGASVITGFVPDYPEQVSDGSYGLATTSEFLTPVPGDAPLRALVPTDGSLGMDWIEPGFDDSGWIAGTGGVGLERSSGFEPFIGTDVEEPMYDINSTCYVRIPFDIADPEALDSLTLKVRYDDGFVAFLNGVRVTSANAPETAELSWDSRAESSNSDSRAVVPEEFDISDHLGLLRAGANLLAVQALNFSPSSSDFLFQCELETVDQGPIDPDAHLWFPEPTPGAPNRQGFTELAPRPVFSRDEGAYAAPFQLELSSPDPDAQIRYTLDGTRPSETSTLYAGPIDISQTRFVTARVFKDGVMPGRSVRRAYTVLAADIASRSSDIPVVLIDSFGIRFDAVSQGVFQQAFIQTIDVGEDGRARISGTADWVGRGGIKVRGSSSAGFPKKQYAVELWDQFDEDNDVSLLGMPSQSDWILYAPYSDKSLMRNVLAYEWSNTAGRYATRTRFCEVYFNDRAGEPFRASNYLGVFVLIEKIKRDPNRVDIARLEPGDDAEPEITGGYILKKDRLDPGDTGMRTSRGQTLGFVYPKEREITAAQRSYIQGYMNEFENALYGANFTDPVNGYRRYADVGSFIDHHIMVEITKNIDGYRLSTFLFKDRGGKIHMGPIWDYNLSLGNADYLNGWQPNGWYYPQLSTGDYPWYPRLFQDPSFVAEYRQRWLELRRTVFTKEYLLGSVDRHAETLLESQARNFQRWRILGQRHWPNWHVPSSWQDELDWMRNDWLDLRIDWIDSQFILPPSFDPEGGFVDPGTIVEILAPDGGEIWYTTDDSDPQGPNGQPSATAVRYEGPIEVNGNTLLTARILMGGGTWSGLESALYVTEVPDLRVTEIMYNPPDPTPAEDPLDEFSATRMEFIEIANIGTEPLSLTGVSFVRGVSFDFSEDSTIDTLAPGQHVVVVNSLEGFRARYGSAPVVAGVYTGSLSNSSETVLLTGDLGVPIQDFAYDDDWYPETDGAGHSLVIRDPQAPVASWDDAASWAASAVRLGSPGAPEGDTEGGLQLPSDVSQDGQLNLTDAVALLGHLFLASPTTLPCGDGSAADPANVTLLDSDGSGVLDLTDGVRVLTFLFQAGPPPVGGTGCVAIPGCPSVCVE